MAHGRGGTALVVVTARPDGATVASLATLARRFGAVVLVDVRPDPVAAGADVGRGRRRQRRLGRVGRRDVEPDLRPMTARPSLVEAGLTSLLILLGGVAFGWVFGWRSAEVAVWLAVVVASVAPVVLGASASPGSSGSADGRGAEPGGGVAGRGHRAGRDRRRRTDRLRHRRGRVVGLAHQLHAARRRRPRAPRRADHPVLARRRRRRRAHHPHPVPLRTHARRRHTAGSRRGCSGRAERPLLVPGTSSWRARSSSSPSCSPLVAPPRSPRVRPPPTTRTRRTHRSPLRSPTARRAPVGCGLPFPPRRSSWWRVSPSRRPSPSPVPPRRSATCTTHRRPTTSRWPARSTPSPRTCPRRRTRSCSGCR